MRACMKRGRFLPPSHLPRNFRSCKRVQGARYKRFNAFGLPGIRRGGSRLFGLYRRHAPYRPQCAFRHGLCKQRTAKSRTFRPCISFRAGRRHGYACAKSFSEVKKIQFAVFSRPLRYSQRHSSPRPRRCRRVPRSFFILHRQTRKAEGPTGFTVLRFVILYK